MKPTAAFRALQAKHWTDMVSTKTLLVKRLNKDGSVSRARFTSAEYRLNAFTAEQTAEANARRLELERLNPGTLYCVVGA